MHRNYCLFVSEDTCPSREPVSAGLEGRVGCLELPGRRKDAFLFLLHSDLRGREDPGSLRA